MSDIHNVFISHYSEDDDELHRLKQRLTDRGCTVRNSSVDHERPWVNYEIRSAYMQGKKIIGVYMHGCKDSVELPEAFKRYGGPIIGWNSTDKLDDMIEGDCPAPEKPSGTVAQPIYNIIHIKC